jgi:hypothetical protein
VFDYTDAAVQQHGQLMSLDSSQEFLPGHIGVLQKTVSDCVGTVNAVLDFDERNQKLVQEKLQYLWDYSQNILRHSQENFQIFGADLEVFRQNFNGVLHTALPQHFQQVSEVIHQNSVRHDQIFCTN